MLAQVQLPQCSTATLSIALNFLYTHHPGYPLDDMEVSEWALCFFLEGVGSCSVCLSFGTFSSMRTTPPSGLVFVCFESAVRLFVASAVFGVVGDRSNASV